MSEPEPAAGHGRRPEAPVPTSVRCFGDGDPLMERYHDREWGFPTLDERGLFERMSLEAFQSGLSWRTILAKREAFRAAFAGFDPDAVAGFDAADVGRLLDDAGIVRNRAKIEATLANARATVALRATAEPLDALVRAHAPAPGPLPASFRRACPSSRARRPARGTAPATPAAAAAAPPRPAGPPRIHRGPRRAAGCPARQSARISRARHRH
jgi:DNA-3-methyladenine glycosylase I